MATVWDATHLSATMIRIGNIRVEAVHTALSAGVLLRAVAAEVENSRLFPILHRVIATAFGAGAPDAQGLPVSQEERVSRADFVECLATELVDHVVRDVIAARATPHADLLPPEELKPQSCVWLETELQPNSPLILSLYTSMAPSTLEVLHPSTVREANLESASSDAAHPAEARSTSRFEETFFFDLMRHTL